MTARPDPVYEAMAEQRVLASRDAAVRAYIHAKQAIGESTGRDLTDALLESDWAWHELLVAYGEPCGCEPGSCPSAPPEEIVVELPEG